MISGLLCMGLVADMQGQAPQGAAFKPKIAYPIRYRGQKPEEF